MAGKGVIVIGGTAGIGHAGAKLPLGLGAHVTISGRNGRRLGYALARSRVFEGPGNLTGATADVGNEADLEALLDVPGAVDHVFATAGRGHGRGAFAEVTKVGVVGAYVGRVRGAIAAAPVASSRMAPGELVTLASGTSFQRPLPGLTGPSGSVGGVESVVRGLALELAPARLRVSSVRFGTTDTDLMRGLEAAEDEAGVAAVRSGVSLGRVGIAEEEPRWR